MTIIKDESFVKLQIKQSNAYNQKDFVSKVRLDSEFKSVISNLRKMLTT